MTLTYLNNISIIHIQEDNNPLTLCDMYVNKEFAKISVKNANSRMKDWCIFCTDEIKIEETDQMKVKYKFKNMLSETMAHYNICVRFTCEFCTELESQILKLNLKKKRMKL